MILLQKKSEGLPRCELTRKSSASKSRGCKRCVLGAIRTRRKPPLLSLSAAPQRMRTLCPPFWAPSKPTRPSGKFRMRCAVLLANTRNPSSSEQDTFPWCPAVVCSPHQLAMKLILASASTRRAEILRDAGLSFVVLSSAVDETPYQNESPHDLVERLASAKAELAAARAIGPAIVIAADTVISLDGHILGKPRSSDDARHMLE